MDYETADGSQFSLREEWSNEGDFQGTLVTAFVEGNAFVGKSPQRVDNLDESDVLQLLEPVPSENTFPLFSEDLVEAPPFDPREHYLKAPQFSYEDREAGRTFVADRMRGEIEVLERLSKQQHPNVVAYFGCVVKEDRITHICLRRGRCNLVEYHEAGISEDQCNVLLAQIRRGLEHLHSLGIAHNDINPGGWLSGREWLMVLLIEVAENICIDDSSNAVIVDFDSALPFGERLLKGKAATDKGTSHRENDYAGLSFVEDFLLNARHDSAMS